MTRTANARVAGLTFLVYIAAGMTSVFLFRRATGGEGVAAKLAGINQHAGDLGALVLLGLVQCFSALVLGVTLYAITRDEDQDLALLALACRVGEGIIAAFSIPAILTLFWLATATGAEAPAADAAFTLAGHLLREDAALPGMFFAVGSALYAWLMLRGRMIPIPLAWLGVVASVLLVLALPLRLAQLLHGPVTVFIWLPMLAFEVPLGFWLIIRGATIPYRAQAA